MKIVINKEISELRKEVAKLKAENWVLKDNSLRTYDGLTHKAARYEAANAMAAKLAEALKSTNIRLNRSGTRFMHAENTLAEYQAYCAGEKE